MRQKFFILIYTLAIVVVVSALYYVVVVIQRSPATPPSAEEAADVAIGQYPDRQNANVMPVLASRSVIPILSAFMPNQDAPSSGCSLRFSLIPARKAVEPNGMISYTLTLANQGSDTCQNVSLSDYYTDKEHFISSNPSPTASDYYWNIGNLSPGVSKEIDIVTQVLVGDGDQVESSACVAADNSKDVCTGNVVFVQRGASLDDSSTGTQLIQKITGAIWGVLFGQKEFGIWVWDSPLKMTSAEEGKILQVSKQNGFNVIYVTVDDYISITQIPDAADRANRTITYMQNLANFIQAAHNAGIQVDVVGGDKDWAEPENRWKGYALIDFVKQYNLAHPSETIRALQYDVEPYLLSGYEGNKKKELTNYVEFIDESVTRMQSVPAKFSIVIPHFYDDVQNWTPVVSHNGKNQYTFNHLLEILQRKPGSEVIIMAYRNFFDGNNGAKQVSETEINEATKGKYSTKIIIAQETGDVSPSYVTFYDYPKSALFNSLNQINIYFGRYQNFGGTAVHYFDSFVKLQ